MSFPLESKLSNGATVSDWLGTSMTAAHVATRIIEDIRRGDTIAPVEDLSKAIEQLEQALEEARIVQTHVASIAAYGEPLVAAAAELDAEADTSLRPRPGETAEETVDRVVEAVRRAGAREH